MKKETNTADSYSSLFCMCLNKLYNSATSINWTHTHTHRDKYKHILKNTLCLWIWYAYRLILSSMSCTWSQMQTGNCRTESKEGGFYYTWLHCLSNSYINSELDLCQRDCQCDTKCRTCFLWKITLQPPHMNSVISIQVRGKPWHMHGSSALSFFVGKQFLSCRSTDTYTHSYT